MTGPLGVGKSSVINALIAHPRGRAERGGARGRSSSPFSGGSVLGDRIRLDRAPGMWGSTFARWRAGAIPAGLRSPPARPSALLEAAGFDVVLVETVGSGQVDVEIRDVATTSVVVLVPHLGDEVQTMKAGLFEIADVSLRQQGRPTRGAAAERDLSELAGLGTAGMDGARPSWSPRPRPTRGSRTCGRPRSARAVPGNERSPVGGRASTHPRTRSWGSSGTR